MVSTISARSSSSGSSNTSLKLVGNVLALVSGVLIGTSFVFKKKGLLRAQAGGPAGEGVAYLKSVCCPRESRSLALAHSVYFAFVAGLVVVWNDTFVCLLFRPNLYCDVPIGKQ